MPFEDRTAWSTVLRFIGDYRPDCVIQLGHLVNLPPLGRLSGQATAELRRRELTDAADYVGHHYLSRLRQVHYGPLRIICGAASARLGTALHRKALPGKAAAMMHVERRLVELDAGDAVELSTTYTLAPGWTLLHGDTIAVADSEVPGNSALQIARQLGVSVIVGHTMRLGKGAYTTTGADGAAHTVTGVEIGHLVDRKHAKRLIGRAGGWQHGFAIVEAHGARVSATCLPLSGDRATVLGTGGLQTGEAAGTRRHPLAAHTGEGPAAGHAQSLAAATQPSAPTRSRGSTVGRRPGSPAGTSGFHRHAGPRVGETETASANAGIDPRPGRSA